MDEKTEQRLKASLKHLENLQTRADLLNSISRGVFKGENDPLLHEYEHYLDSIYDYMYFTQLIIRKLKTDEDFVQNEKDFEKRNDDSDDENCEGAVAKPKKVKRNKRKYDRRTRYEK